MQNPGPVLDALDACRAKIKAGLDIDQAVEMLGRRLRDVPDEIEEIPSIDGEETSEDRS